ncbi:hypothetical protein B0H63DRAFT_565133 [Podospora didyma]|uniref:Amine oxidase domain-containing protein n=1 Tax=Podospora didyma TaxID=330526 RepID=A0AAE0N363_9PEZI|nr:hypothetical protein B0H63DRAFT_565133 [Podospora didyma]
MSPDQTPDWSKAPEWEDLSAHTQWAAQLIRKVIADIENKASQDVLSTVKADEKHQLPVRGTLQQKGADGSVVDEIQEFKIGIIGAGAAGLFTAMILDHLNEKYQLNAKYEILEANTDDRLGGRLFTYYFKDKEGKSLGGHQYYDVGAMRFPHVSVMNRTFQLFEEVGIKEPVDCDNPKPGDLIRYYFTGTNTPTLYNGVQTNAPSKDFTANTFKITGLRPDIAAAHPDDLIEKKIRFWKKLYRFDPEMFWDGLTSEVDMLSVRQFLTNKGYDYDTIEYLETVETGNRWYDQAVSEMILESIDFDSDKPWSCIEGGTQEIAKRMLAKLNPGSFLNDNAPVLYKKPVKAISYVAQDDRKRVQVVVGGEEETPRTYHAVFNSAPLGAMQHMQLEGLNLGWEVKRAIRNLGYGASCKVGIRFKRLWWLEEPFNITEGGVGKTDLPIRNCVYPSYNIRDEKDKPGVLLASYTWSQEADRIGALIARSKSGAAADGSAPSADAIDAELQLKELLLHDLCRLHLPTRDCHQPDPDYEYRQMHKFLLDQYLDHFAWDWSADPYTVGAFAYFGPGQFQNMYPGLTKTDGKHIIIGEAASAHHAWVVGALESAVRGVYQFLFKHSKRSAAAARATEGYNCGKVRAPFGPLPSEYDRTSEVDLPDDVCGDRKLGEAKENKEHPPRGEWARAQVVFESARLRQGGDVLKPELLTEDDVLAIKQPLDRLVPA